MLKLITAAIISTATCPLTRFCVRDGSANSLHRKLRKRLIRQFAAPGCNGQPDGATEIGLNRKCTCAGTPQKLNRHGCPDFQQRKVFACG